eukprot:TRINITY_DN877_c0_g1_i2.p1 TRINITY_DN877_c0_g1~~TRINITY_DN877_c0_g1_i2.p1  ORF type:complete len:881 (+),score=403.46 TRINITY_DN877_c0_g1_i2:5113-7755(+)
MTDSKYFNPTKKGEMFELKEELNSFKEDKKKDAVKKVIAAMTVGKDVSGLFTDVLNCIQTNNLELKKLVYLYLMNYAKTQPDRAILAVNTFVKDSEDPNPLIRALAIRTMGCIRVDKIVEYLCEPLRKSLRDRDPYVLKTAAICVAKLFDINPSLCEEQGFLEMLRELLADSNPMVVANAVAALSEIDEISSVEVFSVNRSNLSKLLAALDECTEWGQAYILNALSRYTPVDEREAETIAERVAPRLQHANSAVVLSSIRVLMKYLDSMSNQDVVRNICKKLGPPLVTLLSKEPEIQYVALRNIALILQKRPTVLQNEMRVFFCKYNDPIYVKMEKLEIMIMLANEKNIDQVLLEFKEYASEVDVEFVRKAVRAIGRCAIKLEKAAEKCVHVLLELIKTETKVNYVVQETIIVIKDIFRKYPNRYESIISTLCENLESLDEPEAKASMIWIIGEYADRIDNAAELLQTFAESFKDEPVAVQLQLLTAVVKLFLRRPKSTQQLVESVLKIATQECDNPDLRDRGFLYWRLLATNAEAAKKVVLAEKPLIRDDSHYLDQSVLDELINNISTLASVYHRPAETFVPKMRNVQKRQRTAGGDGSAKKKSRRAKEEAIFDMEEVNQSLPRTGVVPQQVNLLGDDMSFLMGTAPSKGVEKSVVLAAGQGQGLEIRAAFVRRNGEVVLDSTLINQSQAPMSNFVLKFNKNIFNLAPAVENPQLTLMPGQSIDYSFKCNTSNVPGAGLANYIQAGVAVNAGVRFFFNIPLSLHVVFTESGRLDKGAYLDMWRGIVNEKTTEVQQLYTSDVHLLLQKLESFNVFFIAKSKNPDNGKEYVYMSVRLMNDLLMLVEFLFEGNKAVMCCKTNAEGFVPMLQQSIEAILQGRY